MKKIFIFLAALSINKMYAECSDLNQTECNTWSEYCEWNDQTNECNEIGGGGGGNSDYGPYEFAFFRQDDGMQTGSLYADVTVYYPLDALTPYSTIILGAGWGGDQSSMTEWANFLASYGIVAATIQYNDPSNDSHQYRSEAILELIGSLKLEHTRNGSPINGGLDTNSFAALGYSLSGGVVQLSATLDSTLEAVIALNPTIIVEDCELCSGSDYCICLVPEFLDHSVPTLIISGENEIDELSSYEGLLGSDQYENTPISTEKMLYEIANGGHSSAESPSSTNGQAGKFVLNWLRYFLLDEQNYCDSLIVTPDDASQFLTTITCNPFPEQGITQISSGTSFGECLGYCLSDLLINEEQITYDLYGWDQNDPIYIPIKIEDIIQAETWQNLLTNLNSDTFMSLDNTIGCPDCSDGGAEWFEIVVDDMIKRVTIEYGSSVEVIDDFINAIRIIRQDYEDIQSCYFTPNPGICLAAIPKYYFDQDEQECMTFTWGGCAGLVPFDTMDECESSCFDNNDQSLTGYLRAVEASFCMDDCGMYYLEDENGQFISNISNTNNINNFEEYFINRFVQIEGQEIQCVECNAINVSSIQISNDCENPVSCFVDPCTVGNCSSNDNSECIANYCGACYADYYENNELIFCNTPQGMVDLTGINFGDCEMALGFGWANNHCEMISGCGDVIDGVNYSGAFFNTLYDCIAASTLEIDDLSPGKFALYQNHPNPFNPSTLIIYQTPVDDIVNITIYDMKGRVIKTLVNGYQSSGSKTILWNALDNNNTPVSAGIYLYSIHSGDFKQTKKMLLLK